MSEKSSKPTKKTGKKQQSLETGGTIVHGGIHASHDVIMHDQYNLQDQRTVTINTPAEFIVELRQLHAQIAALKQQPQLTSAQVRNIEVVEVQVEEAVKETQKPQPLGERIKTTLIEAKDTMDLLAASLGTAAALGTTIGGLALLAIKVFGG